MYYQVSKENFVYTNEMKMIGICQAHVLSDGIKTVAVFTEIPMNLGPSVTNAIECIVDQFCKMKDLDPDDICIIERYAARPDDLDRVVMPPSWKNREGQPNWIRLNLDESKPFLSILKD